MFLVNTCFSLLTYMLNNPSLLHTTHAPFINFSSPMVLQRRFTCTVGDKVKEALKMSVEFIYFWGQMKQSIWARGVKLKELVKKKVLLIEPNQLNTHMYYNKKKRFFIYFSKTVLLLMLKAVESVTSNKK